VVDEVAGGLGCHGVGTGPDNLVDRALRAVGRRASVRLVKRIPVGAGLGGGSADAGAVLRWAGRFEPALAASIGADVPFCVVGGRARVTGIGDVLEPMPFVERRLLLLLPPLAMDTAAVYRAYDAGAGRSADDAGNDLEAAAVALSPALGEWRDALWAAVGSRPRLAGSGAAWFVEADGLDEELVDRLAGATLIVAGRGAPVLSVRTVPALVPDAALPPREAGV
jgi:4-diphosphocytidyl-2-C-methyl-D-erythritol kinase